VLVIQGRREEVVRAGMHEEAEDLVVAGLGQATKV
jgi:hypothetical protein